MADEIVSEKGEDAENSVQMTSLKVAVKRQRSKSRKCDKQRERHRSISSPPDWDQLPDLILEDVFSRLSIQQRYYASLVCRAWNRAFYVPGVWSTFVLGERTMTRRKYNYYMGYQHTLDHYRTQICLNCVGRNFRRIVIQPISNFFNLYEFMNMLSYFAEFFDENPLRFVHTLEFSFACHVSEDRATGRPELVFGTGGRLLQALKRLMSNLPGLQHLILNDLLLDYHEALNLLDDVAVSGCLSLRTLRLVNCSKVACPILHVGVLLALTELRVSPQQLSDDVVSLLASVPALRNLHLVQTTYTDNLAPISSSVWSELRRRAPRLKVHLVVEGNVKQAVLWQPKAPVRSITYDSAFAKIAPDSVMTIVDLYCNDLEIFAHMGLPRFYMPCPFDERADSTLLYLCRQCPNLHTLVIRERISTATVLLIASTAKNLCRLVVRRNALVKRSDWPKNPDWTEDFYWWLRSNSRSYESVEREVTRLLGLPWHPLPDKQFKTYKIDYSLGQ